MTSYNYNATTIKTMKQKVSLDTWQVILSLIITSMLILIAYYFIEKYEPVYYIPVIGCLVLWSVSTLLFMPMSIEATDTDIEINMSLRHRNIPLKEIRDVKPYIPGKSDRRIIGSGGLWGYWGWFYNSEFGRYFAYYGRKEECFLITLDNGRRYVLGCDNAILMTEAINKRISR